MGDALQLGRFVRPDKRLIKPSPIVRTPRSIFKQRSDGSFRVYGILRRNIADYDRSSQNQAMPCKPLQLARQIANVQFNKSLRSRRGYGKYCLRNRRLLVRVQWGVLTQRGILRINQAQPHCPQRRLRRYSSRCIHVRDHRLHHLFHRLAHHLLRYPARPFAAHHFLPAESAAPSLANSACRLYRHLFLARNPASQVRSRQPNTPMVPLALLAAAPLRFTTADTSSLARLRYQRSPADCLGARHSSTAPVSFVSCPSERSQAISTSTTTLMPLIVPP